MKLNLKMVKDLLDIISGGLCHGAGNMTGKGNFCVQQAVTQATGYGQSDRPACVGYKVRVLGVKINDFIPDTDASHQFRSNALRRFAVAELGSDTIDQEKFELRLIEKWNDTHPDDLRNHTDQLVSDCYYDMGKLAELVVQVLIDMESPGTKYLYMCGDSRPGDPQPTTEIRAQHLVQEAVSEEIQNRLKAPPQLGWRNTSWTRTSNKEKQQCK